MHQQAFLAQPPHEVGRAQAVLKEKKKTGYTGHRHHTSYLFHVVFPAVDKDGKPNQVDAQINVLQTTYMAYETNQHLEVAYRKNNPQEHYLVADVQMQRPCSNVCLLIGLSSLSVFGLIVAVLSTIYTCWLVILVTAVLIAVCTAFGKFALFKMYYSFLLTVVQPVNATIQPMVDWQAIIGASGDA